MIVSIRRRRDFDELRANGRTARSGPISIRYVADPGSVDVAVGYAIGRRVGNAVVRNRVRRRLREIVRMFDRQGQMPPGMCLVVVAPGAADGSFASLERHLRRCVSHMEASA